MSKPIKALEEIIVDVTEEEYQAELANGLQDDEVLRPGRHVFRRGGFQARHARKAETAATSDKVRVALDLDQDVVDYFREQAAQPNATPYDEQINTILREAMAKAVAA